MRVGRAAEAEACAAALGESLKDDFGGGGFRERRIL